MSLSEDLRKFKNKECRYRQLKNRIYDSIWHDYFDDDIIDFVNTNTYRKLLKLEQKQYDATYNSNNWRRITKHIRQIHRMGMNIYIDDRVDEYDGVLPPNERVEYYSLRHELYGF